MTDDRRRPPRVAALVLIVVAALLLGGRAATALAHANYVRSVPTADARLTRAPSDVRIVFSEPADPRGSAIAVQDAAGKRVDRGDVAPSGEANGLKVSLGPIGDGGYVVAWTSVSAVDGHESKGSFAFTVGNAALPTLPDLPDPSPPPSLLEILGRLLSFGGVALALGLVLFAALVVEPSDDAARRREGRLLVAAGVALVAGAALLVVDQGARLPPRLGLILSARALGGLAIAAAQLAGPAAALLPATPRRLVTYAAGLGGALTLTFVSHAAASGTAKDLAVDFAHVVAISAWVGGLVGLGAIALPSLEARDEAGTRRLGAAVARFSTFAMVAVAVIVATGSVASLDRLVVVNDLWETPYGIALLAKLVLLAGALALAAFNLLVWGPRLRRGAAPARAGLLRSVGAESGVMAVVLLAAAFLTSFAPPATAAVAYDEVRHAGGLRLELLVPSTAPGRNRYILRIQDGLTPVTKADKVAFTFSQIEHDMGESEIVAVERAPGEYVGEGSPTSMYGTWRVLATVRRAGREDVRTEFILPIEAPSGAVSARAIPVGPYVALVFLDPGAPVAGTPVAVNVILVNAKGDPVAGKTLGIALQGPAPARATASDEGNGRYVFSVTALDAGAWKATVQIQGEASFGYDFEVAP